jgi:hypothetical protein
MMKVDNYKKLLRHHFYSFVRFSFNTLEGESNFNNNWHIELLCANLTDVENGRQNRLTINLPPRSLKSFVTSICFPAWVFTRKPNQNIIIISESQSLADDLSDNFKRLISSDRFRAFFPDLGFKENNRGFSNNFGGSIRFLNIYSSIAGKGADYIILDDPMNPSKIEDINYRNHISEIFNKNIRQRLNNKNGKIIVCMQRLHDDDLCGELLKDESWGNFSVPALFLNEAVYNLPNYNFPKVRQAEFAGSESFHEDRFDYEELVNLRYKIGAENFRTQYLQCEYESPNSVIHAPKDVESVYDWINSNPPEFVIKKFLSDSGSLIVPAEISLEEWREKYDPSYED